MNKKINILLLPGDGVGPEVCREAKKIIQAISERFSLDITLDEDLIGGASIDKYQTPITNEVILKANSSDAILLGGVEDQSGTIYLQKINLKKAYCDLGLN